MTIKESILRIQQRKASATAQEGKPDAINPINERVLSFKDACRELGIDYNQFINAYEDILPTHAVAYLKLCIIAAALNEGWEPKYSKDESRYYPAFEIHQYKDKIDMYVVGEFYLASGGFSVSSPNNFTATTFTEVGVGVGGGKDVDRTIVRAFPDALAMKSPVLALFFGNTFLSIWKDYLITFQAAI